jgi:hypothetical protein
MDMHISIFLRHLVMASDQCFIQIHYNNDKLIFKFNI